jgi:hypothetical protein
MVCPELTKLGVFPLHIRKGSQIETQEAAENRLLAATGFEGVAANTLFPGGSNPGFGGCLPGSGREIRLPG